MIEVDNKVYRNIPEQVGKNKYDIELLKKAYGYHGPFASKEDIVSPVDQALYLIGTAYPYEIYQYKELTNTYLDLGPFAAAGAQGPAGPQGPQGPQGIPGEKGDSVDAYTKEETNTLLNGKANKSTTYTKNTVDALFNKRFWNWKFENDFETNQGGLYHGEDTIISNNYDKFSGYIIGDWNNDYLLTGMSDRPKYSNSDEIKDIALLEDVNKKANSSDVYTKSETYTKTETDTLLNGKYDVKVFTIEKGSIGDEISVDDFFNYLITLGFNSGQYLNKICRFSYVDSMDYKYEYLVIPTYFDASYNYSNLTIISDGGVYHAYIAEDEHGINTYVDTEEFYSYCGDLNNLQTKDRYDLVSAINEVDSKTGSLYSYLLDTAGVDIDRNIPSTVDVGGVTYDLVDKVKARFNILGGRYSFLEENLLNIPDVAETTKNGVTYSIKGGIIRINGTATSDGTISSVSVTNIGKYYFQPFMSGTITPNSDGRTNGVKIIASVSEGSSAPDYNQAGVCINPVSFKITYVNGATYNNVTFRPALIYGSTPPSLRFDNLEYVKILGKNSKVKTMLKNELAALKSYLLANYSQYGQHLMGYSINNSVYNYIDFANKKFIINCAERSYQAGDEADPNIFTDLTKSVYKLETPIEVNISSIINDDSGITPPLELGGRIIAVSSVNMEIEGHKNIEMVYTKTKKTKNSNLIKKLIKGIEV